MINNNEDHDCKSLLLKADYIILIIFIFIILQECISSLYDVLEALIMLFVPLGLICAVVFFNA